MIKLSEDKQSVNITHLGHSSSISISNVLFIKDRLDTISITCPECLNMFYFPVSGGADALGVQEVVRELLRIKQSGRTFSQAHTLAKFLVAKQDGLDRWRLN